MELQCKNYVLVLKYLYEKLKSATTEVRTITSLNSS